MHPSFDWFCQHRRRRPSYDMGPYHHRPMDIAKGYEFPNSSELPLLRRRRLSLFYPTGGRRYFLHDDSSSKIVKTIRHLRSIVKGLCSSNSTSPFGRPRERWYLSSLTWTFQLPLLGRSIKTSSTIILINVSSTMMISSIVDGFGSYYSVWRSRERNSCVFLPLLLLTSATQSHSIGFICQSFYE